MKAMGKAIDGLDRLGNGQKFILLLLAGVLTGFSFAPFYILPFMAISFPLLLLTLRSSTRLSEAFSFGCWFGFGQFFMGLIWLAPAFEVDGRFSMWVGYLAVASLAAALSLYTGGVAAIVWRLTAGKEPAKHALPTLLYFVIFWNLSEWLRGHIFTGFPWNLSGYVWGFSDVMLQSTALWGIYGLGIPTLFLALLPYLLIMRPKSAYRVIGTGVIIISVMGVYGLLRLSEPTEFRDDVKLKIIQANISQEDKWNPARRADNFIKYMEMSKSQPGENITHVIWPETAVIYPLNQEPSRRFLIADILEPGTVLMTGFPRVDYSPEFEAWNSLAVIDSAGNMIDYYDKSHLVPFGEYMPEMLGDSLSFLGLGMLVEGFSYSRGAGLKSLHMAGMPPVGILICYEIIFSGDVVNPDDRPAWLLNITNDAWFGDFNGPYQHLIQTRVRAIEEGLPIIRSAGTGISAVIDPYGRIVKRLSLNKQGVMISYLPVALKGTTLYMVFGTWMFSILLLLLYVLNIHLQRKLN